MIEVKNLTRCFGDVRAVDSVSFDVNDGEVFGFLGPNGAGKTTTIRMLCTLISPTSGSAKIEGLDISDDAQEIRKLIGLLPEVPGFYERLTLKENLEFYARLYDVPEGELGLRMKKYLEMVDLWDKRDVPVATFSKGMKQKAAIVRAVLHEPKYLFFDEPTAGLDPAASRKIREFIIELKRKNRVIFLNTHNLDEAERICDRIAVIRSKLIAIDKPSELEKSIFSMKTKIELARVPAGLKKVMKGFEYEVTDRVLIFRTDDPGSDNPKVISRLVKAGAKVVRVSDEKHTLEDVYIKLIKGE